MHRTWRFICVYSQALADDYFTRRSCDGVIACGEGESSSASLTVWSCRSGRFRPTALPPMGRWEAIQRVHPPGAPASPPSVTSSVNASRRVIRELLDAGAAWVGRPAG